VRLFTDKFLCSDYKNKERLMKTYKSLMFVLTCVVGVMSTAAQAQIPPEEDPNQLAMLESNDPQVAANKRHVFDFWRIVYEGGHMDRAPEFMTESYIQHNPNVVSGRDAFVEMIGEVRKPMEVLDRIKVPVVSIIGERDIVMVSFVRPVRDRNDPDHIYKITWFDVFRIEDGLIAEHWDSSDLWVDGQPPGAEFLPNTR
jgi:predicted SnoaL-like aldol condensation-catalyzing enzyme